MGAQGAPPETTPVLRAETRVVQIDVVATDSHHQPIANLTKRDFLLTDNGKARPIDIFSSNAGERGADTSAPAAAPISLTGPTLLTNRNPGPPKAPAHSTVIVLDQVNAFFEDAADARRSVLD